MKVSNKYEYLEKYKLLNPLEEKKNPAAQLPVENKEELKAQLVIYNNDPEEIAKTELTSILLLIRYHHMNSNELKQNESLKFLDQFCKAHTGLPDFNSCCGFIKNRYTFPLKEAIPTSLKEVYKSVPNPDLLVGYLNNYEKFVTMADFTKSNKLRFDHNSFQYLYDFIGKQGEKPLLNNKRPQSALMFNSEYEKYEISGNASKYVQFARDFSICAIKLKDWGPWLQAMPPEKNPVYTHVCARTLPDRKYAADLVDVVGALGRMKFSDYVDVNSAGQYSALKTEPEVLVREFKKALEEVHSSKIKQQAVEAPQLPSVVDASIFKVVSEQPRRREQLGIDETYLKINK